MAAVTPRTRLIAISHVLWTTGQVLPVRELREETGLPILVDGAQSVGAMAVDVSGLDFYTVSGQKWLCGPEGTGALVVADPESLRVARPSYLSQQSHQPDGTFVPRDGACSVRPQPDAECARRRTAGGDLLTSGVGVRARGSNRRALPRASARGRGGRRRPRRDARPSWHGECPPRSRPTSFGASPRPTSSCANFPEGDSFVHRSAGGRANEDLERLVAAL